MQNVIDVTIIYGFRLEFNTKLTTKIEVLL